MSIKHLVLGCLEGVFALGQVYVLVSRVTDPKNFSLVGIPPRDLVDDLAQALLRAGIDVDSFFEKACQVSGEWKYDRSRARVLDRIQQKFSHEWTVPLRFRTLGLCLIWEFMISCHAFPKCDGRSQPNVTDDRFELQ